MTNKPKIQIQFPNLLLIPIISLIGIVLKSFGLTQYDWLHIIVSIPVAIYFIWSIGYCILSIIGILVIKLISKM